MTVLIVTFIYSFYTFIFFLKNGIETGGQFQCYENPISIDIIIYILIIILLLFFALDIALNVRLCLNSWRDFWYKYDPFFIRLQQALLVFLIVIWLIGNIIGIVMFAYTRIPFIENLVPDQYYEAGESVDMIFQSLNQYGQTFYFSGFLILVTLLKRIRDLYRLKPTSEDSLKQIFNKKPFYEKFKKFTEQEWSLENLLIYEDILKYEKLSSIERRDFANLIFKTYMNGESSELEVNLPGRKCRLVKDKIDNLEVELENDLFNDIITIAKDNLADTFSRFIISDEYVELIKKIEYIRSEADLDHVHETYGSTERIL